MASPAQAYVLPGIGLGAGQPVASELGPCSAAWRRARTGSASAACRGEHLGAFRFHQQVQVAMQGVEFDDAERRLVFTGGERGADGGAYLAAAQALHAGLEAQGDRERAAKRSRASWLTALRPRGLPAPGRQPPGPVGLRAEPSVSCEGLR